MLNYYWDTFIPVEIHIYDSYATTWGNSRKAFYGASGTPTAWFDGELLCYGAYESVQQMYNWYMAQYNARMDEPTDVTVDIVVERISDTQVRATVTVGVEPDGSTRTIYAHVVQLLDHWPSNPSYSRNTVKQGATVESMILSPGDSETFERVLTLDSTSWANEDDVKIVAWAQHLRASAPAEIFNANQVIGPFEWETTYDLGDMNCDESVDFDDITAFILAIQSSSGYAEAYPDCDRDLADCNQDGNVNFDDIPAFVQLLSGS